MIKLLVAFLIIFIAVGSIWSIMKDANKQQWKVFFKYCATLTLLSAISIGLMIFISNF